MFAIGSMLVVLFIFSWCFAFLALYFLPPIIAYVRRHKHVFEISILTLFLGWSFIGWICAILWAFNSDVYDDED